MVLCLSLPFDKYSILPDVQMTLISKNYTHVSVKGVTSAWRGLRDVSRCSRLFLSWSEFLYLGKIL